ncbi:ABC-type branched-subunit amino acid transport system ATPase component/branched-subunit amino acid ABC-type transport system permease component [Streptomyces sp. V3I8]|uniref:ABC transporter permease subunit n=1 Tax=Streptomyces sp. V3I8 TaxID=3042279 RepID=UPI00278A128A|nr:ATP-binding cassette domain-containing protein [Streptomyces sp. V3I8]MDQ1039626.1 ABC-type branched-subunit amino acid transport system ATPase component/branched-subunit amino acid ABC-type transport system permease component [Streptomyces sp. V3I8]
MTSLTYDLTLAGLSVGSAAALTGIGLVVTHRATGVLNFAHGAIAMVCAYLLRQLTVEWHWPLALAAPLTLLVVAPAIGVALERCVFRPLSVLGGDPAQTLVASIGVFVLLVGGAALVWGPGARPDAPALVPRDPWGQSAVALVLAAGVGAVIRRTRFGRELRAVVDDRPLAALSGIDADRVAAAGWAFGSFTAGLTGVLLAPYVRLDPYGMPLLVMEVVAVAVAARMRSLPVAVVVALGIGIAQSQLTRLHPPGRLEPLVQAVGANLFVVALLVAALVLPGTGTRDALPRTATARVVTPPGAWIVAVILFLLPLGFAGPDLHTSVQVPALGVVLLSLVVVTGRGGQISLGQAAYAGLGALFTALLAAGRFPALPELPETAALLVAVLLVAPLGLLTGRPAIGRHGLALALATFAVGVGVSRFVFAQPYATSGLALGRPAGFEGDRAYYALELVLLAGALLAAHALRRGRTGRALAAMRDHEAGASAAGVRVPALKLTAFVAGAALAALGGGMLGMGVRAFDPAAYDPVRGLLWFAAVVVLGADSVLGALLGAALLVGLDAGARGGVAAAVVGLLAVLVGRFPGGPYEALRQAAGHLRPHREPTLTPLGTAVRRRLRAAARDPGPLPAPRTPAGAGTATGPGPPGARTPTAPDTPRFHVGERPLVERPIPPDGPDVGGTGLGASGSGGSDVGGADTGGPGPGSAAGAARPTGTGAGMGLPGAEPPDTGPDPALAATSGGRAGGAPGTERPGPGRPGTEQQGAGPTLPAAGGRARGTPGARPGAEWPGARPGAEWPGARPGAEWPGARPGAEWPGAGPGAEWPGAGPGSAPVAAGGGRARGAPGAARAPAGEAAPALRARGLRVAYDDGFTALDGVDLDLPPGRVTAVVGPNGAGKSTLFHCLAGTVRPASGRVVLGERDITRLPAHARTRLGIARTFQQLAVFPTLTVAENVRVGAEQGRVVDADAAERALRLLGLDGSVRALPAVDLPTGTLRRVELARALAGGPRILLLDEPAAGLDTGEVTALTRVLRALAADGTALLVVEHDLDLVADLADTVHVMTAGRIVASGPADRVLDGLDELRGLKGLDTVIDG